MKKSIFLALSAAVALVGCSRQGLVTDPTGNACELPIEFSVQKKNLTKVASLESVNHYNFGVYAYKVNGSNSLADAEVMNNYLVGYSNGTDKGYDNSKATTFNGAAGTSSDHTSPWFYEGLGNKEYTYDGTAGFYTKDQAVYMSNNEYQYLRYWDLAYANTNFYCYAPYNKKVSFSFDKTAHTGVLSFPADVVCAGYDDRSLTEYMYAGKQAKNSDLSDVDVEFKHMGAMLNIRFYEDIPGYKVKIINLDATHAGIYAAPAEAPASGTTYAKGEYYTTHAATVSYDKNAVATYKPSYTGGTSVDTPLVFQIPTDTKIPEDINNPSTQTYSYSPTTYYPVEQPADSKTGFTFHISYQVIADDNQEVITVHNATVHVPYAAGGSKITVWEHNVKYTYTFKFTKNTTGTTDPGTTIDPTDPTPSTQKSLYPIVFDNVTIADYTENASEYVVSDGTNY